MKKMLFKILLFIMVVLPSSFNAQPPNWQWAKIGGSSGKDAGNSVAVDAQGNVYVLGVYRDASFNVGALILANAGDDDIFLAKYNPNGSLIWAKSIGNTGTEIPKSLIVDKFNNVYITGEYDSPSLFFGSTTLINPNTSNDDFFIAKYDGTGQVVWVKNALNSNYNSSNLQAIDGNENSYFISKINGVTVIEKFNVTGNIIWSQSIIGNVTLVTLSANNSGVSITGGFFGSQLFVANITLTNNTTSNFNDMFIIRMDTSGNVLWARNAINNDSDFGFKVSIDLQGNSYVLGNFSNNIIFDNTTLVSNGDFDLFLAKYNSVGQVIWAKSVGGTHNDWIGDMLIDVNNDVYIIGESFSPSFQFASSTFVNLDPSATFSDIYILKFNWLGNEVWLKTIQANYDDFGKAIAISVNGEIYVAGAIEGTLGTATNIGSSSLNLFGHGDFFLAKLSSTVGFNEVTLKNSFSISPNPTTGSLTISQLEQFAGGNLTVTNVLGQVVLEQQINATTLNISLAHQPKGIYLVKISGAGQHVVQKVVLE